MMAFSAEEIARDILVAAVSGRHAGTPDGEWLGKQYKALVKAVGEASRDEIAARREHDNR